MFRLINANLNGIRSAAAKGFFQWLPDQDAHVVCIQELKAQPEDLTTTMLRPAGYRGVFHCANRKGYSGVGLYFRREPDRVVQGIGIEDIDAEGRFLQADFGNLSVVSLYVPSGSSSPERLAIKFSFLERVIPTLHALAQSGRHVVLCGDWNIAHKSVDLENWRSNQKNSGFLPEERAWMDRLLGNGPGEAGLVDVFRTLNPHPEQYTWWSNRGQAWAKNVGWRIDYQIVSRGLAGAARSVSIHKSSRFSDHAPLTIDYAL